MHNKDIAPALLYHTDCELIIFVSDSELKLYVGMTKYRKQLFPRKQLFVLRKQLFMAKSCVEYN